MGLATGLIEQLGQTAGKAARLFVDAAAAPFANLVSSEVADNPSGEETPSVSTSKIAKSNKFAELYSAFEESLSNFLSQYPGLPKLRVRVSEDSTIRLLPAEAPGFDPETAGLVAEIEGQLNSDHQLGQMASQIYESKSLERWRNGLGGDAGDVEMIVAPQNSVAGRA